MTAPLPPSQGFLAGQQAVAALVLWASGQFDTAEIATLLHVRAAAVYRTLHTARDGARIDARTRR